MMCVNDGVVTNPLGQSEHKQVAGWYVDSLNASEIEIVLDSAPAICIRHPRSKCKRTSASNSADSNE